MTVERGIIVAGDVMPGTERVIRDSAAWWATSEWGTRPRGPGIIADEIVDHWTAGHLLQGPKAGAACVRRTKARKSKKRPGQLLEVGFHFLVAADGLIFQTADLAVATVHVGHRPTILRSIGIERAYPGTHARALQLGIEAPSVHGTARGGAVKAMQPPDEIVEASVWLVGALISIVHPLVRIPRRRAKLGTPGLLEHADMPLKPGDPIKIDCAGLFFRHYGVSP